MRTWKIVTVTAAVLALALVFAACGNKTRKDPANGSIEYENGSIYEGAVSGGKANGKGKLTLINGDEYEGTFVDDLLQGYGTFLGTDNSSYEGNFKDGKFDGLGTLYYSNMDMYVGNFSEGQVQGFGRKEFVTGCVYEGDFVAGLMEGYGWMTWPNGDKYFGEWSGGDVNGFGTKYFMRNAAALGAAEKYDVYTGYLSNGLLEGYGVMRYAFGAVYEGQWQANIRHGYGRLLYEEREGLNERMFVGTFDKEYENGYIRGNGTMYYVDGTSKTGYFEGVELKTPGEAEA